MKISQKTHQSIRLQNIIFSLFFLAIVSLLAWLSTQYSTQSDWTNTNRNSLSPASITLLEKLNKPIQIEAFSTDNELLRKRIKILVAQYSHHKSNINLNFINPDIRPDIAREEGITSDGQLLIKYGSKRSIVSQLDEQSISNTLQSLALDQQRWLVFLEGHGERSSEGNSNFDLALFVQELKNKGINSQKINLIETPSIPKNTSLIVLASPQVSLLKGEIELIEHYLLQGGNLLILAEPGQTQFLEPLTTPLNIKFLPGIVVDATTQTFGLNDPTYALITHYPDHLITKHLKAMSLFPGAVGLSAIPSQPFVATTLLSTLERSWTETDPIEGNIQFDNNTQEKQGPVIIGAALTRLLDKKSTPPIQQRTVIIGDGDFLSNAYLANGANLNLGLSIVQWLNHDDDFINVPAKTATDQSLEITQTWSIIFGLGFLFFLPAVFIGIGVYIWFKRKKQ